MQTRALEVYLDGRHAGTVAMTASGGLNFLYEEAYRKAHNSTPLSVSMPLEVAEHKNRVVLPFLQGLLPDNAQALASIARTYSVSASSPFALLEHIGAEVAGALQFVARGEASSGAETARGRVKSLDEVEIEEMLTDAIREYRDGTPLKVREGRFSLAGAQPKIALHQLASGKWSQPQDAAPTTHILKPNAGDIRDIDAVEQITMTAAKLLGLTVAESYVTRFGEMSTFVTKRYDRVKSGRRWRRLHQEDLCQALGVTPTKKYQRIEGGPGVADVAKLTEFFPVFEDRRSVAREFFRAFVFNVVVGGTDAHAKNYSLLLDGERVQLAPLYDLATFAPYRTPGEVVMLPMHVNGKYQSDSISTADLVKAARRLRISTEDATAIVEMTRAGAVGAFERSRDTLVESGAVTPNVADSVVDAVRALPLCRERPELG